jgi:hypothetical protein
MRHGSQLRPRLRECDVQDLFAPFDALSEELEAQRRFAAAGIPFDEIHTILRQSAAQNLIEPGDAGCGASIRSSL